MTDWYYADATHTRQGPVTTADLLALHRSQRITDATLLWRDGMSDWQPWHALQDALHPDAAAIPPAASWALEDTAPDEEGTKPSTSTGTVAGHDDGGWRPLTETDAPAPAFNPTASPYAPPAARVAGAPHVEHGGEIVYAGFWKRVAAYVIDSLVVGIVGGIGAAIIGAVVGGLLAASGSFEQSSLLVFQLIINVLSVVLYAAYYAGFHASSMQATPGKMAVGIKVVRTDGNRIGLGRGIGRYFATILSGIILGIGFLMAAFTQRKQTLHDMVCDTLVVDKWAFTSHPELQRSGLDTVTKVVLAISAGLLALGLLLALAALFTMTR